MTYCTSKQ